MNISWFRDLVIIIWGILGIIFLIVAGLLAWAAYRRMNEIGDSAARISGSIEEVVEAVKATADDIASVSSFARSEIAEPLTRVAGLVQGVSKGFDSIMGLFHRKRRDNCE